MAVLASSIWLDLTAIGGLGDTITRPLFKGLDRGLFLGGLFEVHDQLFLIFEFFNNLRIGD